MTVCYLETGVRGGLAQRVALQAGGGQHGGAVAARQAQQRQRQERRQQRAPVHTTTVK